MMWRSVLSHGWRSWSAQLQRANKASATCSPTSAFIPLTDDIAEQAVLERRRRRIKLPDAIILATATVDGGVLVTRNTRDFPENERHIRIPYRLPIY